MKVRVTAGGEGFVEHVAGFRIPAEDNQPCCSDDDQNHEMAATMIIFFMDQ